MSEQKKKPKRPMSKSLMMVRQQLADLYVEAQEAKKRGELVGWSASIYPQELCETLGIGKHTYAAGCTIKANIENSIEKLLKEIKL